MIFKNWRHHYSSHPEDFDFGGNPLPTFVLVQQKKKKLAEELLRELIDVARLFPTQFGRLLAHSVSHSRSGKDSSNGQHRR